MLLLSPIFVLAAVAVRCFLGSPVIFRQIRPGKNEIEFGILKFRSMSNATDPGGELLPDHRRITKFGAFLRLTSLDELPSLVNVVKGEMSLVGPRPLLPRYLPYYTDKERIRFQVRPGITGLAQVLGRNRLPWNERLAIDIEYVQTRSFLMDLKILAKTVWKVLVAKDVAVDTDTVEPSLDQVRAPREDSHR